MGTWIIIPIILGLTVFLLGVVIAKSNTKKPVEYWTHPHTTIKFKSYYEARRVCLDRALDITLITKGVK